MKHLTFLMIAATWLTFAGCEQSRQPAETPPRSDSHSDNTAHRDELHAGVFPTESSTNTIKLNGWTVSYPKSYEQMGMTMNDGVLAVQFENFTFKVDENVISVDNQEFGTAAKNDVILIGLNGEIAVNGKIRQPTAQTN